ncbi:hypothetical protein AXF42_Ash015731 [Apostasia shenzhenica]|uniref:Uncharacterized protein n=1 Tax=Apostasia shenzhenica TaxID=1088818 RepID=A0A2H9ZU73_9ASPA|nr:hypothetical protein AXF42_Ash015731 [Apostasia shenzhenica]
MLRKPDKFPIFTMIETTVVSVKKKKKRTTQNTFQFAKRHSITSGYLAKRKLKQIKIYSTNHFHLTILYIYLQ